MCFKNFVSKLLRFETEVNLWFAFFENDLKLLPKTPNVFSFPDKFIVITLLCLRLAKLLTNLSLLFTKGSESLINNFVLIPNPFAAR